MNMIKQEARKKQEIVKQAIKNGYATQADKYKSLLARASFKARKA